MNAVTARDSRQARDVEVDTSRSRNSGGSNREGEIEVKVVVSWRAVSSLAEENKAQISALAWVGCVSE